MPDSHLYRRCPSMSTGMAEFTWERLTPPQRTFLALVYRERHVTPTPREYQTVIALWLRDLLELRETGVLLTREGEAFYRRYFAPVVRERSAHA